MLTPAEREARDRLSNLPPNTVPRRADVATVVAALDRTEQQPDPAELARLLRGLLERLEGGELTADAALERRAEGALVVCEALAAGRDFDPNDLLGRLPG